MGTFYTLSKFWNFRQVPKRTGPWIETIVVILDLIPSRVLRWVEEWRFSLLIWSCWVETKRFRRERFFLLSTLFKVSDSVQHSSINPWFSRKVRVRVVRTVVDSETVSHDSFHIYLGSKSSVTQLNYSESRRNLLGWTTPSSTLWSLWSLPVAFVWFGRGCKVSWSVSLLWNLTTYKTHLVLIYFYHKIIIKFVIFCNQITYKW